MGFLSGVGSALVGAGGGLVGAFVGNEFNKGRMKDQYAYNKEMYENRYQWQMEDMRKAGLNPMLSAHTGAGGAGSVGLPGTSVPDLGSSAVAGMRASTAERQAKQQIKESKARTKVLDEQAQQEFFKVAQESWRVHSAAAEARLRGAEASAYERFGPSGFARMAESIRQSGKSFFDMMGEWLRKDYGPRSSIYPQKEGTPRFVGPPPGAKERGSSAKSYYRDPDKPWKQLRRQR